MTEQDSTTGQKIQDFFKKQKTVETRNKAQTPTSPRDLERPEFDPLATSSAFAGYTGRSPGITISRKASQSTFNPDTEYQVDETVYYQAGDKPRELE